MERTRTIFRRLRHTKGQTMTEYALILATVVIACASLYNTAGVYVKALVDQVCNML
jgi:Flp pilus assembly pilin Flp